MSKLHPLLVLPLCLALNAQAKPLVIANDAWRASALNDIAPLLRACLPKADASTPARLPQAKPAPADVETPVSLQEPSQIGQGYWYRLGWRAKDGTVYIVGTRSPDGQRLVFGPVNESWTCLPAEVRKALAD